jgi:hypothetical protein
VTDRGQKACIFGVGESEYTKWGGITDRSEFELCCDAILKAAKDAGLPPSQIDGFASYSDDALVTVHNSIIGA